MDDDDGSQGGMDMGGDDISYDHLKPGEDEIACSIVTNLEPLDPPGKFERVTAVEWDNFPMPKDCKSGYKKQVH
jgi:hypothetical protein